MNQEDMQNKIDSILKESKKNNELKQKKERKNKGKSVNAYVSDYCVVDIETTDSIPNGEIIEIGAIKVRNHKIIDTFSTLIKPPCYICIFITELTGITNDMVKDAPVLDDVIDKFLEFVGNDIIVGYNNSSFDMCVLYDYILKLRGVFFSNNYEDVLHVARRSIKEISHYSLETLCNFWGFDNEGEHRALIDCYLTKKCYDKLYHEYGNEVFKNVRKTSEGKIEYASKTLALKELEIIIKYLLDESFDSDSIKIMKFWLNKHIDLENKYPFEELHNTINEYESNLDLCWAKNTIQKIMNPVESNCIKKEDNKNMSLDGKHICLTGNFEYGTKLDVEKFIVNKGGIIDKTVKKGTDYLIVGGDGNKNWTAENYGNKVKKALEFNKRGGNIMLINEADILHEPIRGRPGEMAIFLGI